MASVRQSLSRLSASGEEGRSAAAALAAAADPGTPFGEQIRALFEELAAGGEVVVLRSDREVTPAGAAEILGVSRQFVDRLIGDGVLTVRRLPGSNHRRIRVGDVLAVADEREQLRQGRETLNELLS